MALFPILVNQAGGEYMEAVLVTDWHKAPGDAVREGELLVTVETAKAATEIVSHCDGWLAAIHVPAGHEAPLDVPLGEITDTEGEMVMPVPAAKGSGPAIAHPRADASVAPAPDGRLRASPYARRLGRERGVALDGIAGTGPGGRIKARDLPKGAAGGRSQDAPVVLLHGFGADRTSWHWLRALLTGPAIALDLPGHGRRTDQQALGLADIVEDLGDQLDALGLEEVHLVGHSLGGAAALALAASGRVSVRSMVLIAPAGLGASVSRAFTRSLLEAPDEAAMQSVLGGMVADATRLPSGLAAATLRRMDRDGARAALTAFEAALFDEGDGLDLRVVLGRLPFPIRVIWGRADRVIPVPPDLALPGQVALHLVDAVGHAPHLESADLVARLISETQRSAP